MNYSGLFKISIISNNGEFKRDQEIKSKSHQERKKSLQAYCTYKLVRIFDYSTIDFNKASLESK